MTRYEAFTIDTSLDRMIKRYMDKVGAKPTTAIIPEGMTVEAPKDMALIPSPRVSCIMLTHEELDDEEQMRRRESCRRNKPLLVKVGVSKERDMTVYEPPEPFNELGFYPGWEKGVHPPYWGTLRNFVFNRDGYKCSNCGNSYSARKLIAHHVVMKEHGGTDSARNIITLCEACHMELHDYYNALVEAGACAPDVPIIPLVNIHDTELYEIID